MKIDDVVVLNLNGAEQDVRVVSIHETNETIDVEGVTSKVKYGSVSKETKGSIRFWRAKGKDEPVMDRAPAVVVDAVDPKTAPAGTVVPATK